MIVYGDPAHESALADLADRLCDRISRVQAPPAVPGKGDHLAVLRAIDGLRALLIEAGQLEQAVADTPDVSPDLLHGCEFLTTLLAECFCAMSESTGDDGRDALPAAAIGHSLEAARRHLRNLSVPPGILARVKTPEGFAFYTLYPEQYAQAALQWSTDHPDTEGSILVVGIRSIGTTLSAVVTAALRGLGRRVRRLTVRPSGHPFERHVELPAAQAAGVHDALVVDEGPGLSGSSMAAAAAALVRCGLARDRISFLPGHAHPPGTAAGSDVRAWWASTPKYIAPLHELRWAGRSLERLIADATTALFPPQDRCIRVEDLSAGAWRHYVYRSSEDWPAVCGCFERSKYRCVLQSARRVLWKFAGLQDEADAGAPNELRVLEARNRAGWAPRPLAHAHGFVVTEWVEGEPLDASNPSPSLLHHMGRYIAGVTGPVLKPHEARSARDRLKEMLYWNTRELLGEPAAEQVCASGTGMEGTGFPGLPAYGDGRMAPHEWVRTPDGRLVKTDSSGHAHDHTAVGVQPVLWDLAGAGVEWDLDGESWDRLIQAAAIGGENRDSVRWYAAAYCAFRAGQCRMCAGGSGESEKQRLERAVRRYTSRLCRLGKLDLAGVVEA